VYVGDLGRIPARDASSTDLETTYVNSITIRRVSELPA
jgi:hypothetical protein